MTLHDGERTLTLPTMPDVHPLLALTEHLAAHPPLHTDDCPGADCSCGVSRAIAMLTTLTSSTAHLALLDALVLAEEGMVEFLRLREQQADLVKAWLRGGKVGPKPDDHETWMMRDDVRAAHRVMHETARPLERQLRAWLR